MLAEALGYAFLLASKACLRLKCGFVLSRKRLLCNATKACLDVKQGFVVLCGQLDCGGNGLFRCCGCLVWKFLR